MSTSPSALAVETFLSGYNCAQAVLSSVSEDLGLSRDQALRLACGFGAGFGREQEVCGAVSGAVMALGLQQGRGEGEDKQRTEQCYARTRELIARFKQTHGSIHCRDLLGCDLQSPEGQATFKESNLLRETCARCVETAVQLLGEE